MSVHVVLYCLTDGVQLIMHATATCRPQGMFTAVGASCVYRPVYTQSVSDMVQDMVFWVAHGTQPWHKLSTGSHITHAGHALYSHQRALPCGWVQLWMHPAMPGTQRPQRAFMQSSPCHSSARHLQCRAQQALPFQIVHHMPQHVNRPTAQDCRPYAAPPCLQQARLPRYRTCSRWLVPCCSS